MVRPHKGLAGELNDSRCGLDHFFRWMFWYGVPSGIYESEELGVFIEG